MAPCRLRNSVTALTLAVFALLSLPACTKTITETLDGDTEWDAPAEWERDKDSEPEGPELADNTPLLREAVADESSTQWGVETFKGSLLSPALTGVTAMSAWRAEGEDKGGLYIGTNANLYYWDAVTQVLSVAKKPAGLTEFHAINDMLYDEASGTRTLYILAQTNLSKRSLYAIRYKDSLEVENGCQLNEPGTSLTFMHNILYIGTSQGVYTYTGGLCSKNADYPSDPVIDLAGDAAEDRLALLTSRVDPQKGLLYELHIYQSATHSVYATSDDPQKGLLRARPTSVALFRSQSPVVRDEIWISYAPDINGNPGGLQKLDAKGVFTTYKAQVGGLPSDTINELAVETPSGRIWLATPNGALLLDPTSGETPRISVFSGQRYLLDEDTTSVGFDNYGGVWLGQTQGLSRLSRHELSLAAKDGLIVATRDQNRHYRRVGSGGPRFLSTCRLTNDSLDSCTAVMGDNDAFTTGLYALTETLRALATQDTAEKLSATANAKEAVAAELELLRATELPGLPARAIQPRGQADLTGDSAWRRSSYYDWLGDTDDAALIGQMAAYSLYYDSLAGDAEKTQIKDAVKAIAAHLKKNKWQFMDLTGKATSKGRFGAEDVTGATGQRGQGGLRALEILAFLRFALHVTGDTTLEADFVDLAQTQGYEAATRSQATLSGSRMLDYRANLLAALSFFMLLHYEPYAENQTSHLASLKETYKSIKGENNPLQTLLAALYLEDVTADEIAAAIANLRETPLERIAMKTWPDTFSVHLLDWRVQSCWRADYAHKSELDADGLTMTSKILPVGERRQWLLMRNPYTCDWLPNPDAQESGASEDVGFYYSLPYWLSRHYGLIAAP